MVDDNHDRDSVVDKFSDHVIEADDGPFKESTSPMVDLDTYEFTYLITGKITPE